MNLFSLKIFMGSSIFFSRALDQVIAPATRGELRTRGGLSYKKRKEVNIKSKQDACYTGITRDAGADSFIPTVCFAD